MKVKCCKWQIATLIGLFFGLIASVIGRNIAFGVVPDCRVLIFYFDEHVHCDLKSEVMLNASSAAAMGITLGLVQALLLYKELKQSWLWALTSSLLWIYIGATWASTGVVNSFFVGALSGAAYGSVSGAVLAWMMGIGKGDLGEEAESSLSEGLGK